MKDFAGKTVVITGAASGIGKALALHLAQRRARLALADIDEAGLKATLEAAGKATEARSYLVNVANRQEVAGFAAAVLDTFGGADMVVNNAGVSVAAMVADTNYENAEWVLGVNFWGIVHGCTSFLPQLLKKTGSVLVNVSSIFGLMAVPGQALYCASKFAVRGFTESLRQEIRGRGVHVALVFPAGIRTAMVRNMRRDMSLPPEVIEKESRYLEAQMSVSPAQAAGAILSGVEARKTRIFIGKTARPIDRLTRFFPERYETVVSRELEKSPVFEFFRDRPVS